MNKNEAMRIAGNKLSCLASCASSGACFRGLLQENPDCLGGIEDLKDRFAKHGVDARLLLDGQMRIVVSSKVDQIQLFPDPAIINIDHGELRLRN
jgi:hypothetical protein